MRKWTENAESRLIRHRIRFNKQKAEGQNVDARTQKLFHRKDKWASFKKLTAANLRIHNLELKLKKEGPPDKYDLVHERGERLGRVTAIRSQPTSMGRTSSLGSSVAGDLVHGPILLPFHPASQRPPSQEMAHEHTGAPILVPYRPISQLGDPHREPGHGEPHH